MKYEYKQYYRRKLPHINSPGATLFVTFRLAGSIPQSVLAKWKQEKRWLEHESKRLEASGDAEQGRKEKFANFHRAWFAKFENVLHREATGVTWLKNPVIANLVAESLHHRDGKVYRLKTFCIMSNHVHVVFTPLLNEKSIEETRCSSGLKFESRDATLGAIMHSLKGYTAHEANRILQRTGSFWEAESYDHEVRNDDELSRIVQYVLNNPVKVGLVKHWRDWQWTYLKT